MIGEEKTTAEDAAGDEAFLNLAAQLQPDERRALAELMTRILILEALGEQAGLARLLASAGALVETLLQRLPLSA
jgi:hypothetical protein